MILPAIPLLVVELVLDTGDTCAGGIGCLFRNNLGSVVTEVFCSKSSFTTRIHPRGSVIVLFCRDLLLSIRVLLQTFVELGHGM